MLFVQTDLPEPVVPAIKTWGNLAISPITQVPLMSLPTAKETFERAFLNSRDSRISRRETVLTCLFGTSMPTMEFLSGIAEIRTLGAPSSRAISSARPVSLLRRTPWASWSSYIVTFGPRVTLTIFASTLKQASFSVRRRVFSRISALASTLSLEA